jgi:hypothetical protein
MVSIWMIFAWPPSPGDEIVGVGSVNIRLLFYRMAGGWESGPPLIFRQSQNSGFFPGASSSRLSISMIWFLSASKDVPPWILWGRPHSRGIRPGQTHPANQERRLQRHQASFVVLKIRIFQYRTPIGLTRTHLAISPLKAIVSWCLSVMG